MLVYRLCSSAYARDLSGAGAGLYGGRWNPAGVRLLYTAGSISLACLEYLAHNFHVLAAQRICLVKIRIHDSSIAALSVNDLPAGWNEKTFTPAAAQNTGAAFVRNARHYVRKVPSAIVPDEFNYLLNPQHPLHAHTVIETITDPFVLDSRLLGG
ncbi:MAG TPA: RES family NAD+ phosphorylase [Cyclobacteriaceae bacterium]|nr:RES family NAD+ phosphorylase [Cyclobacteriaceae bacterium]